MTSEGTWQATLRDAQNAMGSGSYGRETGSRRKKLAGYLKAANELRQTYQSSWNTRDGSSDMPGAYPEGSMGRPGEEEMLLFPSYARRHVKEKPRAIPGTIQQASGAGRDVRDSAGAGDAEFWKQQWQKYEDDNAIVDVDVRGWIYTPQSGPLSRKNRLFIGLARQLVGIPAPAGLSPATSTNTSRESSPARGMRDKLRQTTSHLEDELVAREAEAIRERGEAEARAAGQGAYSEMPSNDADRASIYSQAESLPDSTRRGRLGRTMTNTSSIYDDPSITPVKKRASWNVPAQMSQAELIVANTNLMSRLQPFLATPSSNLPITAFFYNETDSRQKTIQTDTAGHFNLRASLDFIPTHVRVLASESLSMTEEVNITEERGISVISDIDDTVKHSAVTAGAREIFRNVFIRDLNDLFIDGVKEWYQRLSGMGVKFHYVSNSPWQMFSVLTMYCLQAGLPTGSMHLKAYTGMFQGIFEPVAERKKGTLERIMRDFPDRRFILIGDSGEADLEVYTDVVLEHPGRVLGIFIRDVTTTVKKGFFDSAMGPLAGDPAARSRLQALKQEEADDPQLRAAIAASLRDMEGSDKEQRPSLPARRETAPVVEEENLIDLDWEEPAPKSGIDVKSTESAQGMPTSQIKRKAPPPRPRKPSTAVQTSPAPTANGAKSPPPLPVSNKPKTALSQKPGTAGVAQPADRAPAKQQAPHKQQSQQPAQTQPPQPQAEKRPPLPTRRPLSAYPSAAATSAARYASSLYSTASNVYGGTSNATNTQRNAANNFPTATGTDINGNYASDGDGVPISKKEELWKRRWARAKVIMDERGIMLRTWRVGADAVGDSVGLVERAEREWREKDRGREKGKARA